MTIDHDQAYMAIEENAMIAAVVCSKGAQQALVQLDVSLFLALPPWMNAVHDITTEREPLLTHILLIKDIRMCSLLLLRLLSRNRLSFAGQIPAILLFLIIIPPIIQVLVIVIPVLPVIPEMRAKGICRLPWTLAGVGSLS